LEFGEVTQAELLYFLDKTDGQATWRAETAVPVSSVEVAIPCGNATYSAKNNFRQKYVGHVLMNGTCERLVYLLDFLAKLKNERGEGHVCAAATELLVPQRREPRFQHDINGSLVNCVGISKKERRPSVHSPACQVETKLQCGLRMILLETCGVGAMEIFVAVFPRSCGPLAVP
jgi:hypothetical protein